MFTIDPKITDVQLKEKDLFKAFFSLNNHQVATPETSLEEARSYVFFYREGENRLSVYIGLHLLNSDRKLFYTNSANPFLEDVIRDIEDEARNFAEDLGALLDEIDFANMSGSERDRWIEGQSIFSQKKEPEAAPSVPPAPAEQAQPAVSSAPPTAPVQAAAPAQPTTSPEPPAAPSQTAPAPPPVSPAPPVPPVQTAAAAQPTTAPAPPVAPIVPQPPEVAAPVTGTTPEQQPQEPQPHKAPAAAPDAAPLAAAAKKRQEIMEKAIKAGITKPPKQPLARELSTATSAVSRDREALARLLTSF